MAGRPKVENTNEVMSWQEKDTMNQRAMWDEFGLFACAFISLFVVCGIFNMI